MSRSVKFLLPFLVLVCLAVPVVIAPPTPHGVAGYVFERVGTPQVPAGTNVRVNESNTTEIIRTVTGAGPFSGRYSLVIEGVNGDYLVIDAWNFSAWGSTNTTLQGDMDDLNINLSYDRSGEANTTIIYPANNSRFNLSDFYNVTANVSMLGPAGGLNCTSYIVRSVSNKSNFTYNDSNNHTLANIGLGVMKQTIWNMTAARNGTLLISVYAACTSDTSNLEHEDWDSVSVYLQDTIAPNITLSSPGNGSVNTSTFNINFSFTAHDFTSPLVCTLVIDGVANRTNSSTISDVEAKMQIRLPLGVHQWSVNCTDEALLRGNSTNFSIEISVPEFQIFTENITFFPPSPVQNQTVIVNASILNSGTNATNVVVQIIQNDTVYSSLRNLTLPFFLGNSRIIVNASFVAHVGSNNIFVRVDPNNIFEESEESDNYANNSFFISAWQIYHGNTTGRLELSTTLNVTILNWKTTMRNIFFSETGAQFSWTQLHPLGLDLTNATRLDDFLQADIALNTSDYLDSLNLSYTNNGQVRQNATFFFFNRTFVGVPALNTTNSSIFQTAALWDAGDGGTEFDGSQDLLFVTRVNLSAKGFYGTYDYEIRVPPGLKDFRNPAFDTITIYVELV